MSILNTFIERLIRRLKSEPQYAFQQPIKGKDSIYVLFYRLVQVIRGLMVRLKLKKCDGLLFCGRRMVIEHGYRISAGKGLILEDNIHINAISKKGIVFGRNVTIKTGAIIACSGVVKNLGVGLTVGDYSAIGSYNYIAAQGGIEIGSNVIIGPGVMIFSEDHVFTDENLPIRLQGETRGKVTIEDNCWIGAGATILKGVTIGHGSVIAAGTVVRGSVAPNTVVAGVPGRAIKSRTEVRLHKE